MSDKKMTSSRRHHLKSLMLQIAAQRLEDEAADIAAAKEQHLSDSCPPIPDSCSLEDLLKLCRELHQKIDKTDEERYDAEAKIVKGEKEIVELKFRVTEMKGMKKPALKKVRMSADQMLQALLGSKHKVTMDLRSNLKQVKKEVKQEMLVTGVRTLRTRLAWVAGRRCLRALRHKFERLLMLVTDVRILRTRLALMTRKTDWGR
ncbi:hypothetical protein AALO_G00158060 [Alosa alosa]|uniref:Uncharacterized protein n=1 Tax=Alosa alosa TaxID=278164 RepID=A0AAV6GKV1_9TELE|nr:hypothetical protein AALO_G00158060 [Alosa alosa]